MLKRDPNAKFMYRVVGFFRTRKLYRFYAGKWHSQREWEEKDYLALLEYQRRTPLLIMRVDENKRRWWMFRDEFYWEDEGYTEEEIRALILDRIEQREKKVKRAMARLGQSDVSPSTSREPIPDDVKLFVWQRDGGRCVKCGGQQNLEFDHIIPVTKGGSNTARNIQLLCEKCNRAKGANLF